MKNRAERCFAVWAVTMLCLAAFLAYPAQAASVKGKALFTLVVNDGYSKQKTTIYETAAVSAVQNTAPAVSAAKSLTVNPAGKRITASIENRTAYFQQNYTGVKVTAKASVKAGKSKKLKVTVTHAGGRKASCKVKVSRPKKPVISAVTFSAKTMKIRKLFKVDFAVTSSVTVKASVQVLDKNGKDIYNLELGTFDKKNPAIVWYWSGLRDDGTFIKKGSYTGRLILSYSYGKKTRTVSRDFAFKAKKASTGTAATDASATSTVTNGSAYDPLLSDFTKSWNWTMMITGDDTVDYLCEYVCQQVLTPKMSQVQRAKALYHYCATHFTSSRIQSLESAASLPVKIDVYSSSAKKKVAAYGKVLKKMKTAKKAVVKNTGRLSFNANYTTVALSKWSGECTNFARMYQVLCRHAGLDADFIHNSLGAGDPLSHYWNVVQIDGKWYECDPRISYLRNNGYVYFARGTKFMETYNPSEGMYNDDVKRYSNIDPAYRDMYAKLSRTDCPGR